jgi:hypothetical protein
MGVDMNKNLLRIATAIVALSSLAAPALAVNGGIGQTNAGIDSDCIYAMVCVKSNGMGGSITEPCNDPGGKIIKQCQRKLGPSEGKTSPPANASVVRLHEPPVLRSHK